MNETTRPAASTQPATTNPAPTQPQPPANLDAVGGGLVASARDANL